MSAKEKSLPTNLAIGLVEHTELRSFLIRFEDEKIRRKILRKTLIFLCEKKRNRKYMI